MGNRLARRKHQAERPSSGESFNTIGVAIAMVPIVLFAPLLLGVGLLYIMSAGCICTRALVPPG